MSNCCDKNIIIRNKDTGLWYTGGFSGPVHWASYFVSAQRYTMCEAAAQMRTWSGVERELQHAWAHPCMELYVVTETEFGITVTPLESTSTPPEPSVVKINLSDAIELRQDGTFEAEFDNYVVLTEKDLAIVFGDYLDLPNHEIEQIISKELRAASLHGYPLGCGVPITVFLDFLVHSLEAAAKVKIIIEDDPKDLKNLLIVRTK